MRVGSRRANSRVAGAPPRTSPDATVPSGNTTTVQPVWLAGSPPVVVLRHEAWQRWFGGEWTLWPIVGLVIALMIDVSPAGDGRIKRVIYPAGFRWSRDMKPISGTEPSSARRIERTASIT